VADPNDPSQFRSPILLFYCPNGKECPVRSAMDADNYNQTKKVFAVVVTVFVVVVSILATMMAIN
jgi:hypothetical protein